MEHKKGFTGIGMIMVVLIIVVIGAVAVPRVIKSPYFSPNVGSNKYPSETVSAAKSDVTFSISGNNLSVIHDGKIIQTLSLGEEGIFALDVISTNNPPAFIVDKDVNFDGYNDVGVLASTGYGGINYFYDFYIFNPTTKKLDKNAILSGIVPSRIDSVKKQIMSTYKSGPGYETETFQWNGSTFTRSKPVREI